MISYIAFFILFHITIDIYKNMSIIWLNNFVKTQSIQRDQSLQIKGKETMNETLNRIQKIGILPVAALDDAKHAIPLAEALSNGGIPCLEVSFCTSAAEESIRQIAKQFPKMLIGAGTITTAEQASLAIHAGAKFIISPEFSPAVIDYCIEKAIPVIPQVSSSDDVKKAVSFGLDTVNFLPDGKDNGLNQLNTLNSTNDPITFLPSGGICKDDISSYLAFDSVLACSWLVNQELIQAGEFGKISALAAETMQTMLGFELAHVGINLDSEAEADKTAGIFESMFHFPKRPGAGSIFAGTAIECMVPPFFGTKGHIGIATNSIGRARSYFERAGYHFNESSAKFINNQMIVIYFEEEVGGFAVHILQR